MFNIVITKIYWKVQSEMARNIFLYVKNENSVLKMAKPLAFVVFTCVYNIEKANGNLEWNVYFCI